jgi:uncharacterized DUF497 family protein
MFFYWDDWNRQHVEKHGVEPKEAEQVVVTARRPYPKMIGNGKWQVKGSTIAGRKLQVIYVIRPPEMIDLRMLLVPERVRLEAGEPAAYVIHARNVRRGEK